MKNVSEKKAQDNSQSGIAEGFFKDIIESLKDYAIFSIDLDNSITSWNAGAEIIFGYASEEVIGKDASILYTPEDVKESVPEKERREAKNSGCSIDERYHVRKDKSLFWGSGLVYPLQNKNREISGYTKIIRNTTSRKQQNDDLLLTKAFAKLIIETAHYPLVVLNNDLTINTGSSSFFEIFRTTKEAAEGVEIFDLWENAGLRELLINIMPHHEYHDDYELEHEFQGQGKRTLLLKTRKLYLADNDESLIKLSIEDITEKRNLEHHKEDFISVASHELKTPVTVIKAFAQLLKRELEAEDKVTIRKPLLKINEQAQKLSDLAADLLNVSELQSGRFTLTPEIFNLCSLIQSTVEDLQHAHQEHRIIINTMINSIVSADKNRIAEVLAILINNAIRYSPSANQVLIDMFQDDKQNTITVRIKDFGIGIPEEERESMFKRFFRTNRVQRFKIPGTGLGLYIASEIIKKHNGRIWFESKLDEGSEFYFSLPEF